MSKPINHIQGCPLLSLQNYYMRNIRKVEVSSRRKAKQMTIVSIQQVLSMNKDNRCLYSAGMSLLLWHKHSFSSFSSNNFTCSHSSSTQKLLMLSTVCVCTFRNEGLFKMPGRLSVLKLRKASDIRWIFNWGGGGDVNYKQILSCQRRPRPGKTVNICTIAP